MLSLSGAVNGLHHVFLCISCMFQHRGHINVLLWFFRRMFWLSHYVLLVHTILSGILSSDDAITLHSTFMVLNHLLPECDFGSSGLWWSFMTSHTIWAVKGLVQPKMIILSSFTITSFQTCMTFILCETQTKTSAEFKIYQQNVTFFLNTMKMDWL